MVYHENELLPALRSRVLSSEKLKDAVVFVGRIPNDELLQWFSAADFYVSASHREGGSFALLEAMACGCVPIVTSIPAAMHVIEAGKYGLYFSVSQTADLAEKLTASTKIDLNAFSSLVEAHFKTDLSTTATAAKLYTICKDLSGLI